MDWNVEELLDMCKAHPSPSANDGKQEQTRAIIFDDRKTIIMDIAMWLDNIQGSAHRVMWFFNATRFMRGGSQNFWQEHRHSYSDISSHLLEWFHNEGKNCLNCIPPLWLRKQIPECVVEVSSIIFISHQLEGLFLQCSGTPKVLSLNIIKKVKSQ